MIRLFETFLENEVFILPLSDQYSGKISDNKFKEMRRDYENLLNEKLSGKRVEFMNSTNRKVIKNITKVNINYANDIYYDEEGYAKETSIIEYIVILFHSNKHIVNIVKQGRNVKILGDNRKFTNEDPYGEEDWYD
jgi:hypothetical protein